MTAILTAYFSINSYLTYTCQTRYHPRSLLHDLHFTLLQVCKGFQIGSLSLFLSQLQIKPKTFFPSSSISLPWINKKQTPFSSSANTLKKNAEHGVKMLKIQIQRFLLL